MPSLLTSASHNGVATHAPRQLTEGPGPATGSILPALGLLTLVNSVGVVALRPAVRNGLSGLPAGSHATETLMWVTAAASPLVGLASAALVALCLWSALALTGGTPRWRPLVAVSLYAEVARAAEVLFISAVLHMRGVPTLRTPGDLAVPTGLDIFFDFSSPATLVVAEHVGLFYLAWVGTLVWGMRASHDLSWTRALAAAMVPWGLGVGYALVQRGGLS